MLRIILATTALAAMGTTGALAQAQEAGQQDEPRLQLESQQSAQPAGVGSMAQGQQVVVNSGDTIVIQPNQSGSFTLNFEFIQTGGAAMNAQAQPAAVAAQNLQQGDPEHLSTENLIGSDVFGANDENIGNVADVVLSAEGEIDAMVVDVGGFLGIGSRQVAIGVDNLSFMIDNGQNWYVFTPFTQEELEAQPEYNQETYGDQRQDQRLTAQPMQESRQ
ncbi:PRC-barrel domain-containing protein [Pelagibacterium luteolum]|uniref:PRC-barrel domain-containing protein n=1 Tax=Pelagibacterium luteolum TaxID=440168 RepID=A0A1G8ALZ6_9HYPH|nr:PRC-barrel domain-containing protein [Pelagibacterium luteolum]SDH21889.1 PRC-barrel domain-containing protein [Pelagibacterium luteolum]